MSGVVKDEVCSESSGPELLMLLRDNLPAFRPDVAVLLGKWMPELGVKVDLVGLLSEHGGGVDIVWPAGELHAMGYSRTGIGGEVFRVWTDVLAMWRWLKPRHDIIQVRDKIFTAILGLAWAKITGRKFVYWMSFPIAEGHAARSRQVGGSKGLVRMLAGHLRARCALWGFYGVVTKRADHLFVQSEAMRAFVSSKVVSTVPMTAVPMGVDAEMFRLVVPNEGGMSRFSGKRVLTYLGALAHARRSEFLLDVLLIIRQSDPNVLLLLAGDGSSDDECIWIRALISDRGLSDHVLLTGWLPQAEALRLVACAEIGLSPIPRGELFDVSSPTKAVEYLALGLPCVGNDIPDQRLVLESSGGGLCVPMEVKPFAEAIVSLLNEPERARQMGAAGRDWVTEHRSYDKLAALVAPVYHKLAKERRAKL